MQLKDILVRDWMTKEVITITSDTPITQAHQIMKKNRIRRVPVVDNGVLVGIVTVGDVREASPSGATTLSIWELNYLWSQLMVRDVMTHKTITLYAHDTMINAARLMLEHKVSGLPVVDENNNVMGIVTESDVFRMLVKDQMQDLEI
jgi:acetoin utilization protein AcuB